MNGVLIYTAGVITGASLIIANHRCIQRALRQERRTMGAQIQQLQTENARLRAAQDALERSRDTADAFRRGKIEGRFSPASDAERFAKTFEHRQVQFGGSNENRSKSRATG